MPAPAPGLPVRRACRYVSALREGGSLPAIVETDIGQLSVAKWRGAGQGAAALVAEVIVGQLGRALGLPIPELEVLELDATLSSTERDQEVQDLLVASIGSNLGMRYLSGALAFDPAATVVDSQLAARVVVFDTFVMNVDRSARNTNLLWWEDGLWLIDHGAALYFHHGWDGALDRPARAFPLAAQHVLLPQAAALPPVAETMLAGCTNDVLRDAVGQVPEAWLNTDDPAARRTAYVQFLAARRDGATSFIEEAERARERV